MKKFFKNKDNIIILTISLIAFIVGILSVGFIKSFIIIGLADLIFFIPTLKKKENKKSNKKVDKKPNKNTKSLLIKKGFLY